MSELGITKESLKELNQNLKKVNDFTNEKIVIGMKLGQKMIMDHAKANHKNRPKDKTRAKEHKNKRFYTVTGEAVGTILPGKVFAKKDFITAEIKAGDSAHKYVEFLEFGTSSRRAFPFMGPALRSQEVKWFAVMGALIKQAFK